MDNSAGDAVDPDRTPSWPWRYAARLVVIAVLILVAVHQLLRKRLIDLY